MTGEAAGARRVLPRTALAVAGLACALAFAPAASEAGGVVVLRSSDLGVYRSTAEAFRNAYGGPVLEFSLEGMPVEEAVERARAAGPEAIVAVGLRAAVLVRDRLPRVPLVYAMVPDPVRHRMVGPLITGVSADVPPALELEVLRSLAPDVRSVAVLVGDDAGDWLREAEAAGRRLGLEVRAARTPGSGTLGARIREAAISSDALWMPADPAVATPEAFQFIVAEALQNRRPLLVFSPALVRGGAFVAAAPDLAWVGSKLADAVRRIKAGERAGDVANLPIRRVRAVANLATARALGRALPAGALTDAELVR